MPQYLRFEGSKRLDVPACPICAYQAQVEVFEANMFPSTPKAMAKASRPAADAARQAMAGFDPKVLTDKDTLAEHWRHA